MRRPIKYLALSVAISPHRHLTVDWYRTNSRWGFIRRRFPRSDIKPSILIGQWGVDLGRLGVHVGLVDHMSFTRFFVPWFTLHRA